MSIKAKMLSDYLKWKGAYREIPGIYYTDHGGPIIEAPPACQIRKAVGDNPFIWCQANFPVPIVGRGMFQGLSDYLPNRQGEFYVSAEPENNPGGILYNVSSEGPDITDVPWTKIWRAAVARLNSVGSQSSGYLWDWFVREPLAHCERLAFFSGVDRDHGYEKIGWFGPGGGQGKTPPVPQGVSIWKHPAGSNICTHLIKKDGDVFTTAVEQDFPPRWYDNLPDGNGGLTIIPSVPMPGFNTPLAGSEVFAGWSPSLLGRHGDWTPGSPGQDFQLTDSDDVWTWHLTPSPPHWVGPERTYEYVHNYVSGEYDWRFLNTMISRTTFEGPCWWSGGGNNQGIERKIKTRWNPMYWDINPGRVHGEPVGIDGLYDFFENYIIKRVEDWGGSNVSHSGVPFYTKFDLKIQAAVFSMRCSPLMADWLEQDAEYLVERLNVNSQTIRVWSHTIFKIQFRQVMPIPDLP